MFKDIYMNYLLMISNIYHSRFRFIKSILLYIIRIIYSDDIYRRIKKSTLVGVILNYVYFELYLAKSEYRYETNTKYKITEELYLTTTSVDEDDIKTYKLELISKNGTRITISSTSNSGELGDKNDVDINGKNIGKHFSFYSNGFVDEENRDTMNTIDKLLRDYIKKIMIMRMNDIPSKIWGVTDAIK